MGEEDVPWEQWYAVKIVPLRPIIDRTIRRVVNVEMRQPKWSAASDRQAFNNIVASTLSKTLHTILTHTSSERGRMAVPLITNATGISPFPLKIAVKVGGTELAGG